MQMQVAVAKNCLHMADASLFYSHQGKCTRSSKHIGAFVSGNPGELPPGSG